MHDLLTQFDPATEEKPAGTVQEGVHSFQNLGLFAPIESFRSIEQHSVRVSNSTSHIHTALLMIDSVNTV